MGTVISAIRNTVPISSFNRGLAGKIFDDVKKTGAKVVMKNNMAECVLLSPAEYMQLMEDLADARLAAVAAERMAAFDPETLVSEADVLKSLGMTESDLEGYEDAEIE